MVQNFKLTVEYDGTAFYGWQIQKDGRDVQSCVEHALSVVANEPVKAVCAGRTDSGVHAIGQVANFKCDTRLAPAAFFGGLNSLLPEDIVIKDCEWVGTDFHARYDARSKVYHYKVLNRSDPAAIGRQYVWHIRKPLDRQTMRAAIAHIIGRHDFKAFEGSGSPRQDTTREVFLARLIEDPGGILIFEIDAEGFLRYMVRNIIGTLVDVGLGKITAAELKKILDSKDRSQAGITAPARGLTLVKVNY